MTQQGDRSAGWALIAAATLSVFAMAHHPAGADAGGLAGIVHGAMIAVLSLTAFGFLHFARRRGLSRPLILAGLVAYAISLFVHLGAATINGFVVPALAARGDGAVGPDVFLLAWETNQALARLGVFATGAAFIAWGADFLARRDNRVVGLVGIAAGAAPALLLAIGAIRMDVAGAFAAYAAHALWSALVGWLLLRGVDPASPPAARVE